MTDTEGIWHLEGPGHVREMVFMKFKKVKHLADGLCGVEEQHS